MALPLACSTTIPKTAASDAPEVMPMKSGEASGLRARVWNIAPESPKAAPDERPPASARGSRSSPTMNWAAGSPAPKIAGTTSVSGTRKSPIETDRQKSAKPTTASTTLTVTERARPVTRARRILRGPTRPVRPRLGERGHSSASRRRRTSSDEERRAEDGGDDPDLELTGTGDDPADHVGDRAAGSARAPSSTPGPSGSPAR